VVLRPRNGTPGVVWLPPWVLSWGNPQNQKCLCYFECTATYTYGDSINYNKYEIISSSSAAENVRDSAMEVMTRTVGEGTYRRLPSFEWEDVMMPEMIPIKTGTFSSTDAEGTILENFNLISTISTLPKLLSQTINFQYMTWNSVRLRLRLQRPVQSSGCLLMYSSDNCKPLAVGTRLWPNYDHVMTFQDATDIELVLPWNSMFGTISRSNHGGGKVVHEQYNIIVEVLNSYFMLGASTAVSTNFTIYLTFDGLKVAMPTGDAQGGWPTILWPYLDFGILAGQGECNLMAQFGSKPIPMGLTSSTPDYKLLVNTPILRDLVSVWCYDGPVNFHVGTDNMETIQYYCTVAKSPRKISHTIDLGCTGPTYTPYCTPAGLLGGLANNYRNPLWSIWNLYTKWAGGFYMRLQFQAIETGDALPWSGNIIVSRYGHDQSSEPVYVAAGMFLGSVGINNKVIIKYPEQTVLDFYIPYESPLPWIPIPDVGPTYSEANPGIYEYPIANCTLGSFCLKFEGLGGIEDKPNVVRYDQYSKLGDGFVVGGLDTPTYRDLYDPPSFKSSVKKAKNLSRNLKKVVVKTDNSDEDWFTDVQGESKDKVHSNGYIKGAGAQEHNAAATSAPTAEGRVKSTHVGSSRMNTPQATLNSAATDALSAAIEKPIDGLVSSAVSTGVNMVTGAVTGLANGIKAVGGAIFGGLDSAWGTVSDWFGLSGTISEILPVPIYQYGEMVNHNEVNAPVKIQGNLADTGLLTNAPPHTEEMRIQEDPLATCTLLCRPFMIDSHTIDDPAALSVTAIQFSRAYPAAVGDTYLTHEFLLRHFKRHTLSGSLVLCFSSTPLQTATFQVYLLPSQGFARNATEVTGNYGSSLHRHEFTVRGDTTVKYELPYLDQIASTDIPLDDWGIIVIKPISMSPGCRMYCNVFLKISELSILSQPLPCQANFPDLPL